MTLASSEARRWLRTGLRQLRIERGLTVEDVVTRLVCPVTKISRLKTGVLRQLSRRSPVVLVGRERRPPLAAPPRARRTAGETQALIKHADAREQRERFAASLE
jgi:hypothetical protein